MKGKVLIVDDQTDVRALLAMVLEKDYTVAHAESGAALQKAFGGEPPDAVLLDVKLPYADGLELLPQIKKRWDRNKPFPRNDSGAQSQKYKPVELIARCNRKHIHRVCITRNPQRQSLV